MAALFDIRELAKVYRMGEVQVHALRQVSLSLDEGTFVCMLGPSGSGKSTLLNIIGGLDVPTSGVVLYDGNDLARADEATLTAYRRRHVGFVFQFYNLIPSLTALENVEFVLDMANTPNSRARATEVLASVGLGERVHHFPHELSGGEQQRVAIARALVTEPDLLLADEPTGNLDSERSREVMELLARLNRERGVAIVLVTHELEMAAWAGRVLRFRDGRIVGEEIRP